MRPNFPIYADYQATTPLDPRVLEAMLPFYGSHFGNPHATAHAYGWAAETAVEQARSQIAERIDAEAKEIIFTSGATEANNLAIKGIAQAHRHSGKHHLITQATEHKCVLDAFRSLERDGFRLTILPVEANGLVRLETLQQAIQPDTLLVSIMAVNNEIGTIQPLEAIGKLCAEQGVLFHSDAAQAFGKIPLNIKKLGLAAMSISGHKAYGPQGIGALYLRRRPRVAIEPLLHGGGQERGVRSGTVPLALAVGLGEAARIAGQEMDAERTRLQGFFNHLLARLQSGNGAITLNGDRTHRWPGNLNINIAGVDGDKLIAAIRNVAVSSGSACASGSLEPSYVLQAIGVQPELARASIRIGIGRFTTAEEVDNIADSVLEAVEIAS
ncbi:aminotransferase class V-fold PLP-dependent enzyme [bacterium]|nr:aminotransferase class V-fold PLP-dependent enzyme [bacterium]